MLIFNTTNALFHSFSDIFTYLTDAILCFATFTNNRRQLLTKRARLGLLFPSDYCILFMFFNWIHLSVLELVDASSGGLTYARQDMLHMNMLCLQVWWG